MDVALFTGFAILGLALVAWVYFDAVERGKAAIPWALSVVFLGWLFAVPLILYVIFRESGQRTPPPPGGARRQALYVVSFAGLGTLLIGAAVLVTATVARAATDHPGSSDGYREAAAGSIAAIVVGAIAWASQWFRAEPRLAAITDDEEFRAMFYLHRAYIYTVIGLACVVAFISGLLFLGGALSQALGSSGVDTGDWLPALGPLSIAALAAGYHFLFALDSLRYHQALARFVSASPTAAAPAEARPAASPMAAAVAATAARYCTNCGAAAASTDAFCSACGRVLYPAGGG